MRDVGPSLIVPIDVTALCVGDTDVNGLGEDPSAIGTKDFAEISDDFTELPWVDNAGRIVNMRSNIATWTHPVMFRTAQVPLQQGIHLHWALPGALTRGGSGTDGSIGFPDAPNRWLVLRIASNHADPQAPLKSVTGWIIESDRLWDPPPPGTPAGDPVPQNLSSRAVPIAPAPMVRPNKAFTSIGRCYPYETWQEASGAFASANTALGYGNETYAAAYPHCRNVFGFHDTLADFDLNAYPPATSRLSYMVAGWHSDSTRDPLQILKYPDGATDAQKCAAITAAYGWSFDRGGAASAPGHTVCSGVLVNIRWDPHGTHYIHARKPDTVTVAIGNTAVEAIAALAASQPSAAPFSNAETLLTALQLGLLPGLDQPGGVAALDDKLHQEGFAGTPRGRIWTVSRATAGNKLNPDGTHAPVDVTAQNLLDAAAEAHAPLPVDLGDALNALNAAQYACDRLDLEVDSLRSQLFADWYKYMVLQYDEREGVEGVTWEDAYRFLETQVAAFKVTLQKATDQKGARDTALATVTSKLGTLFQISDTAAPRFWQPRDPVVLLQGTDLIADARYGLDPRAANLPCRLAASILTRMNTDGGAGVDAAQLPQLAASFTDAHRADLNALAAEAFFVDQNQAWLLASLVAGQTVDVTQIQAAQRNLFSTTKETTTVSFTGTAPAPLAVNAWAAPWIPMLLQWEVEYQPVLPVGNGTRAAAAYPQEFITANYTLDAEDIELSYNASTPDDFATAQTYDGMIVLGRNTDLNLKAQIDAYVAHFPDPGGELAAIAKDLKLSAMAQSLSGLHRALLMRQQTLQLPVSDPLALKMSGYARASFLNGDVAAAIGGRNDLAPVPLGYFNPMRAGWMKIVALRVIDAFGQTRDITDIKVVRARGLVPADKPSSPFIAFPPRFTQPARLFFRWLAAGNDLDEMTSDPATSPVCGWVLFNHLDRALMLYDAGGVALGSLNLVGPLWQGAPGNADTFGKTIEQAFAGRNPHLAKFAIDIANREGAVDFLADLLTAIDRTAANINPAGFKQDQALSVLIGRPLAIVRASLSLELDGLPSLNESWEAYAASALGKVTTRDSCGFASINVPVRLGDLGRTDDGLVGYFIESAGAYGTFYAHAATTSAHGVVAPGPNQIERTADASPVLLTMLVDPCAPVHATTGILPVKAIEIPPGMYSPALTRMAVTFLTAPVLSSQGAFAAPLPDERGYDWSWISRSGEHWNTVDRVPPLNPRKTFIDPGQIVEGWLRLSQHKGKQDAGQH